MRRPANQSAPEAIAPEPPKTVYLQERAPSAATSLGVPANTRYAGKALTINPMAS